VKNVVCALKCVHLEYLCQVYIRCGKTVTLAENFPNEKCYVMKSIQYSAKFLLTVLPLDENKILQVVSFLDEAWFLFSRHIKTSIDTGV